MTIDALVSTFWNTFAGGLIVCLLFDVNRSIGCQVPVSRHGLALSFLLALVVAVLISFVAWLWNARTA